MKYCILIIDGASGLPLEEHNGQTCLELASTPSLDAMAREGCVGMVRTVPDGMEASSACACMSVLGYDPKLYYRGRAGIEAKSMGIPVSNGEVVFRCNLVNTDGGVMNDYSAGHISTEEAEDIIDALNVSLGNDSIQFYPGIGYRHLCKIRGREDTLSAICTPPHDIPDQPIADYLPHGPGSDLLRDLMSRSEEILAEHPVNLSRRLRSETPASMIWLFWGSGLIPDMPSFKDVYGLKAAMTSGVDLLHGLAKMAAIDSLKIPGVTDNLDNDYIAQVTGALDSLDTHDIVFIHIEAPDEAAHNGSVEDKVEAIKRIDSQVVSRMRSWRGDTLRLLIMPDHPTPTVTRTHSPDPVPFLLWGPGIIANGASRFTEPEAARTGLFIDPGYNIMDRLIKNK